MVPGQSSIVDTLSASPRARAVATLNLGAGRSDTAWRDDSDRLTDARPDGHTLSLPRGWRRVAARRRPAGGRRPIGGWPGALRVMRQDARVRVGDRGPFAFVHLDLLPAAPPPAARRGDAGGFKGSATKGGHPGRGPTRRSPGP